MAGTAVGRVRRGLTGTAVAAVAMAALTASQAPGIMQTVPSGTGGGKPTEIPLDELPADGGSPYHTELPPLDSPVRPGDSSRPPAGTAAAEAGIPATVLAAYKKAETTLATEQPGCNLPWELLAAIGKVESGQARGGAVDVQGTTVQPILGPVLDGKGFARIADTDGGAHDGDTDYDRAVGPMQFIPSTWARWGADGNQDGQTDPNNIYDASLAAGRYLCAGGRDLSVQADLHRAILSYNHSQDYLRTVLAWLKYYRSGAHEVPDGRGVLPVSPGAGNPSKPARPPEGHRDVAGRISGTDGSADPSSPAAHRPGAPRSTVTADGTISPVRPGPTSGPPSSSPPGSSSSPSSSPSASSSSSSGSDSPSSSPSGPSGGDDSSSTSGGSTSPSAQCQSPTGSPTESPSSSPSPSPSESESPDGSQSASPTPTPSDSGSPSPSPTDGSDDPCASSEQDAQP